jgi:hypothetical protein
MKGVLMTKCLLRFAAAFAVMLPGAALAAHGKAGLWTVSSTTEMSMTMPGMGAGNAPMAMPSTSHVTHMCMSQEEVDSNSAPHIDEASTGCATSVVSSTASAMTAAMTCNGRLKGTGKMQISYSGAEHYRGSYSFTGQVEGNPTRMTTHFKGDWMGANCGKIKPYRLRTQ